MNILVTQVDETESAWVFEVEISDTAGQTIHAVTLDRDYYSRLTSKKASPTELIQASFEFLLDREPKESVLQKFNLKKINEYFPEYETTITKELKT